MDKQPDGPDKKPGSPTILGQSLPGGLLGLPTEILIIIFLYLPVPDVLHVRSVSTPSFIPKGLLGLISHVLSPDLPALGLCNPHLGCTTVQY